MNDLIRAINLHGFDELVAEMGGDPGPLRSQFGLTPGIEQREETFISFDALAGLIALAATDRSCLDFGMRLAERQGMPILGPVAVIARNAATVHDGIAAIARFMPAHSPALRLAIEPPEPAADIRIRYDVLRRAVHDLRQANELAMANSARIVRLLSGGTSGPTRVWLPHAQMSPDASYERLIGCPVTFSSTWCGLSVSREVMARTIDAADPQTRRLATTYLESAFPQTGAPLATRVGELIRRLLPTGAYSADVVADHLHLHRRTLQRRLMDEGVTYASVLDEQRRDLAVRYLGQPEMQVGQIAVLLGYTEQSAFNRAFRRWFATSPRAFRRSI
ncbi:AraC family transcriptional regulator ligand-binding domain-containing protein [Gordonia sp. PKS22-38]|uniref:AraC family transcriptional regulator ligand-binding domain-containing protein n=1 Tax=Gordonia prachuapensis TaxID=3115651 RepID=A0ABU7MYZ0_9ACTN|nr:AraC family transcriptional regulator ligand-binding domain-containing protein [Gordonia sp. PKS22-38]